MIDVEAKYDHSKTDTSKFGRRFAVSPLQGKTQSVVRQGADNSSLEDRLKTDAEFGASKGGVEPVPHSAAANSGAPPPSDVDVPDANSGAGRPAMACDYKPVRVSDVIVPNDRRKVNQEIASRIAESMRANGVFAPIVVWRRKVARFFGEGQDTATFLVAGGNRLRAAELLGLKEIPAIFFKGDHRRARLVTIEENLFRQDLTVLERAEQYAEWFRIAQQLEVSGQDWLFLARLFTVLSRLPLEDRPAIY